nr:alpha/beta hydrolase fold-3 [Tanacetum cinerariifolium]
MFFVYGYGGTGKTFLYKTLTATIRSKGEIVLHVASSGIASLLIDGGRTTHSWFGIPINIVEDSMYSISADGDLGESIRCNLEDAEEINDFTYWILNIRECKIGGKDDGHAEVEFPEEMLIPDSNDHIESLITEMYENLQHNLWYPTYFKIELFLHLHTKRTCSVDLIHEGYLLWYLDVFRGHGENIKMFLSSIRLLKSYTKRLLDNKSQYMTPNLNVDGVAMDVDGVAMVRNVDH